MRMGYQITAMEARTWICSCSQQEYWMFSKLCHTHMLLLALAWAPVCVNAICICQRIMAIRLGYWPTGAIMHQCCFLMMTAMPNAPSPEDRLQEHAEESQQKLPQ
ncbi:hypothetical protein VPH35_014769 [Triticum aestivum]